jgi:iron complex outermembrane recepter protein
MKTHARRWPALTLLAVTAVAGAEDSPTTESKAAQLAPIAVTGERDDGYVPDTASGGAKGELPLRDIPQSVTVLNQTLIRDLAPRQLDELADYVAGVDREAMQGNPYGMSFFVRGFNTAGTANSYNGFRENGFNTPQAAINIERIEFLKGPASVLSGGNGALSGLVNIVSKRPLYESHNRIETTVGSFDHLMTAIDSTGPLNGDGSLRYRLTASADKDGNFVDDTRQQSLFVSPYLSWDIGANTRLDVELLNQDIERPGREPYFIRHPDFFRIPVETQLGDPGNPAGAGGELTRRLARVDLTHRFGNGWQLRQAVFLHNVRSDDTTIQPTSYNAETQELSRRVRAVDEYQRERTSQTELSGEAHTGALRHQWLAGVEASRQTGGYIFNVAPYTPINIFEPSYPGEQLGELTVPFPGVDSTSDVTAFYLQDLVSLGGGFKLMAGLRYDQLETSSRDRIDDATADRQTNDQVSPRLGLIYQPNEALAWYASWGRSFAPNNGRAENGGRFEPQRGEQYEAGVKLELAQGLAMTAALFEYTRQNILTTDPDNPDFSIAVGEQRARGVEIEAIGRLMRDWRIVASYTYLDAEVTKDNRLPVGDRRQGVSEHSASLFNRVDLTALGLERWSITAGIAYAGARESALPNDPPGELTAADVRLPAYTRVDAGLIWRAGTFEARLNGRNLTDERIYDGYNSTFQPRAPRSVEMSVAVEF